MTIALPGFTVTRTIPSEVIAGLFVGQYRLYGGVIRWAPHTEKAGQIVRHLIPVAPSQVDLPLLPFSPFAPVAPAVNIYQLQHLSGQLQSLATMTRQIVQISTTTMFLAGLNLALSAVGFASLHQRLDTLETHLDTIQKDLQAIRSLLERKERATLCNALDTLQGIATLVGASNRQSMLVATQQTLGEMLQQYAELLREAASLEAAMAAEEYFCLIALARVRCFLELDETRLAQNEMQKMLDTWSVQARRIATVLALGDHPERFLYRDFVAPVPLAVLVEWLNFAHDQVKGYAWIDDLRSKNPEWHKDEGPWIGLSLGRSADQQRKHDQERVIPTLYKLVARQRVLESSMV